MDLSLEMVAGMVESVPSLPAVAARILEEIDDPRTTVKQLVSLIRADPALTAKVLKLVNSALYGFRRRIGTLEQAIPLIGFDALKQLCLGVSILETMKGVGVGEKSGLDADGFWEHSYACACAAQQLAREAKISQTEEAFVAGLIHDLGKLLMAQFVPEKQIDAIEEARKNDSTLFKMEQEMIGCTHARLGGALAQHWNLPPQHIAAVRFHHGGLPENFEYGELRQMVAVVSMANVYVKALNLGDSGCPKKQTRDAIYRKMGLREDAQRKTLEERILNEVSQVKQILNPESRES